MRTPIAALAAATLAALVASQAQAHAHLVKSDPAKDAAIAAPKMLKLQFSEKLEAKFSGVELAGPGGATAPSATKVAGKTMTVSPKAPLAPGAYTVKWTAVAGDGHKMTGDYGFTVR